VDSLVGLARKEDTISAFETVEATERGGISKGDLVENARVELEAETVGEQDHRVIDGLAELSEGDKDYWAFRKDRARLRAHGLTQYPAMMVPSMQAVLLDIVSRADPDVRSVLDPFAGSGTTLVECMRLGLDYVGQDINPLAVLISRVKAGPFHTRRAATAAERIVHLAKSDQDKSIEARFPGLKKWFSRSAASELSRLRRAIRSEKNLWCRRVLWTALAETIRLTCNSRTSTFKLHIRSSEDLRRRTVGPLATFGCVVSDIVVRLKEEAESLRSGGLLTQNGYYRGDIKVVLGDSSKSDGVDKLAGSDLLITSPPYGDNTSTVPYGQYSYLPLQWIDLQDIDEEADCSYLRSTYEIDTRSLGGSRRNALSQIQRFVAQSPSLGATLSRLAELPVDRASRVAAFFRDLESCLATLVEGLRSQAFMVWTVGNRRVGGQVVPTDAVLTELLQLKGVRLITRIERRIPNKRMATRNNIAKTMHRESILVYRKT